MEDYDEIIENHRVRNERIQEAYMILSNPYGFETEEERLEMIEWARNIIHNQGVYIPNQE